MTKNLKHQFACSRRSLLAALVGLSGLKISRAQNLVGVTTNYRPLREPVPVAVPTEIWGSASFKAWLTTNKEDGVNVPELLLNGIVIRVQSEDNTSELHAFCTLCPHEFCHVDYVIDSNLVVMDEGTPPNHPLLFCGCHFSVFNPSTGGKVISGPAERSMYRFEFEMYSDMLYITKVEEDVLKLLGGVL